MCDPFHEKYIFSAAVGPPIDDRDTVSLTYTSTVYRGRPAVKTTSKVLDFDAAMDLRTLLCVDRMRPFPVNTRGSTINIVQHAHFIPIVGVGKRGAY